MFLFLAIHGVEKRIYCYYLQEQERVIEIVERSITIEREMKERHYTTNRQSILRAITRQGPIEKGKIYNYFAFWGLQ